MTVPPRRVLLLRDQVPNHPAVCRQLEALGWDVESFASGEEAVRAIHNGLHVDLLLADIQLPRMSSVASVLRAVLAKAVLSRDASHSDGTVKT